VVTPRRAVFLDRDGVINENVFYPDTGEWEAPRGPEDFKEIAGVLEAMQRLEEAGYTLFIVSNQPNMAKRKASLDDHEAIDAKLQACLMRRGVTVAARFYCFHHPKGLEPALTGLCACRKPSPYFLEQAAETWEVDLSASWMVGDRASDVECGRRAGTRTIRIIEPGAFEDGPEADFRAVTLAAAVSLILEQIAI